MTSLDLKIALVWVRVDSPRIINVPIDDGNVSESLCRNLVQPSADLKPESGTASRRIVEYVGSVDLDDFHHLEKTGGIRKMV